MDRKTTNLIRFFLDECIPPVLRDNRWFMYPFFYLWFKGKNVTRLMEFKRVFHKLNRQDYLNFYKIYDSLSNRKTDLSDASMDFILKTLKPYSKLSVIDVGCGHGYLLGKLKEMGFNKLTGCDINPVNTDEKINWIWADVENLPFHDKEFDIAICNHTLEHVINPQKAVNELKRISRKILIVTVPCQRYYHYTFDLHIHFFPEEGYVHNLMRMTDCTCVKLNGDWCFAGYLESGIKHNSYP